MLFTLIMMVDRTCFSKLLWSLFIANVHFCMVILAVDQYVAVIYPLHYTVYFTERRTKIIIILFWFLSLAFSLTHNFIMKCSWPLGNGGYYNLPWAAVILSVVVFIIIVMLVLYTKLVRTILNVKTITYTCRCRSHRIPNKKALLTVVLLISTYILFYLPLQCFLLLIALGGLTKSDLMLFTPLFLWMMPNAVCDPLIYSLRMGGVKRGYKIVFRQLFCCFNANLSCKKETKEVHSYQRRRRSSLRQSTTVTSL